MWDMRRNLDPTPLPPRRCTDQLPAIPDGAGRQAFLVAGDRRAARSISASTDPGFEVDLYVRSSLRSMTAVWMGLTTVQKEIEAGNIELIGDRDVAKSMQQWLGLSPFAKEKSRVA